MAGYFIESQAEASETLSASDSYGSLDADEWDECMRQTEGLPAVRRTGEPPQEERGAASTLGPDAADALLSPSDAPAAAGRVDRGHPALGRLARAAAALPYADDGTSNNRPGRADDAVGQDPVHEYPEGLADLSENTAKQTTRVVFTINNPGVFRPAFDKGSMAYLVWQVERGEQGTEHIQGYCRFAKKLRLRTIQPLLGGHAHVLIARGTEQQCKDYCTKDDTRISAGEEHGTFDPKAGEKGRRSDLEAIAAKCAAGQTLKVIAAAHPGDMIRYASGIAVLHELLAPKPPVERTVTVTVLWGPSGTGKTHRVRTSGSALVTGGIYVVKPGRGPWDRYQGEQTILFDEFNWNKWEIFDMNQYLDKWDCPLDCRFRDKSAAWTRVVICANSSPLTWYTNSEMEVQLAFRRRLGHGCRHVTTKYQDVALLPPCPDLSPEDGRECLLLQPRARDPSSSTSGDDHAPIRPLAAAAAPAYLLSDILAPDSQPHSPTQRQ